MSLRSKSPKRRREDRERADVVKRVMERDNYECQGWYHLPTVHCYGELVVHEKAQRSVTPGSQLRDDLCVTLCAGHHSWVHDNIALAIEVGLLMMSWDVPRLHWAGCDSTVEVPDQFGNPVCRLCGVRLPAERVVAAERQPQ